MAMNGEAMGHLNFMKKQQWNVAYYATLLLAAVFAIKKAFVEPSLAVYERWLLTALCVAVLLLGMLLLSFIQCDIGGHRERMGTDETAYSRGLEFTISLGLSILVACGTVVWGVWRDCPCWAQ
jgi:hypothetical protein